QGGELLVLDGQALQPLVLRLDLLDPPRQIFVLLAQLLDLVDRREDGRDAARALPQGVLNRRQREADALTKLEKRSRPAEGQQKQADGQQPNIQGDLASG